MPKSSRRETGGSHVVGRRRPVRSSASLFGANRTACFAGLHAAFASGHSVSKGGGAEPISLVADWPVWFVAKAALPPKDLAELIAWMKESPGQATVGIGGVGGGADVVGTYFQKHTGTRFQFVPYRGAAPMIQDLVAGQIDLTFTQVASAVAPVRAGQLKAYVVMSKTRWPATPDTPTIDEAGVPGLHASFWHGLWAPKGTPKDVIATLHGALVEALADPSVRRRLADVGQ